MTYLKRYKFEAEEIAGLIKKGDAMSAWSAFNELLSNVHSHGHMVGYETRREANQGIYEQEIDNKYFEGFDSGFYSGHERGHEAGLADGQAIGYSRGYEDGYDAGLAELGYMEIGGKLVGPR